MTNEALYDALAGVIFVVFTGMVGLSALSVSVRVGRWWRRRISPPVLLVRDLFTFTGLALSFLAVATARAMDLPPQYARTVPWLIFSSAPALIGLAVFLYFEFFVIGHQTPDEPARDGL